MLIGHDFHHMGASADLDAALAHELVGLPPTRVGYGHGACLVNAVDLDMEPARVELGRDGKLDAIAAGLRSVDRILQPLTCFKVFDPEDARAWREDVNVLV